MVAIMGLTSTELCMQTQLLILYILKMMVSIEQKENGILYINNGIRFPVVHIIMEKTEKAYTGVRTIDGKTI